MTLQVVTIMDYSGMYKEEGFFIPLDYGHIVGMVWVNNEVLATLWLPSDDTDCL